MEHTPDLPIPVS